MLQSIQRRLRRITHLSKKIVEFGPIKAAQIINRRMQARLQEQRWRSKAYKGQLGHTWADIATKHQLTPVFDVFWQQQGQRRFKFLTDLVPANDTVHARNTIAYADLAVAKTFDLLGSGPCTLEKIPWHLDMRLYKQLLAAGDSEAMARQKAAFDSRVFYKDIHVEPGPSDVLVKDIKGPWELSRGYHFVALGHAYQLAGDQKYTQAFLDQCTDWLDENPYLLGPNWVCPMEVAIRALNLVYAMYYMRTGDIPLAFWERLTTSLYDHLLYLENNWEIYSGITSNHYMSDLVGYLALCWLFNVGKGASEVAEFEREVQKQVFEEGTDYESTTRYHGLVTELVYHGSELCAAMEYTAEAERIQKKLSNMLVAVRWFGDIVVGDDDSGKLLYHGLADSMFERLGIPNNVAGIRHYPMFGLSLAVGSSWKMSLRHHAYGDKQPTSHLHNDAGSITLSYGQQALVVDPGSYVYTPSATWRNHFRSVTNHNTFYLKNHEPVPFGEHLFALDVPPNIVTGLSDNAPLTTKHDLYARFGLTAHRLLIECDGGIEIHDWWHPSIHLTGPNTRDDRGSCENIPLTAWNFTLAPDIEVVQQDAWVTLTNIHTKKPIARIGSEQITFTAIDGWMSPEYGKKERCVQLRAERHLATDEKVVIRILQS